MPMASLPGVANRPALEWNQANTSALNTQDMTVSAGLNWLRPNKVPLKPGAREFLVWLRQQGIRTGIASSNGIELVETVLKAQGIQEYLESVHTCCEVPKGKPAPDIYLLVAKTLGVKPEECLVFEDVPMGILAGKNAGMRVCAVEDTFSASQREEKKELADYYIESYDEIPRERMQP